MCLLHEIQLGLTILVKVKAATRLFLITLLICLTGPGSASEQKRIAFSFDDVPRFAGAFFTPDQRAIKLIAALDRAGVEQAGFFVTTSHLQKSHGVGGEDRIRAYVAAGHIIANHTHSHQWLSRTEAEEYLADLDHAEEWLADRPGHRAWFRFSYLDEGTDDLLKRDALREGLRERGLMNAYVTVDNYDWYLDGLSNTAKTNGESMDMTALGSLFAETLVQSANFYDEIAVKTLGRSPAHVMLLHETDLAALFIEDAVKAFRKDGWEIISMDEAYADPIASIEPDTMYLGSGRVAAIAHTKGYEPASLVYERTDEEVLDKLFAVRVLGKGASDKVPSE